MPEQKDKFEGRTLIRTLTLPSRGLLYGDQVPNGQVRVAAFTTREEKVFAGAGEGSDQKIDIILRNCVDSGSLPPDELLVGDSLFCLFWVRQLSYGPTYGFQVSCGDCRRKFHKDITLPDSLTLTQAPDDYREPIRLTLPVRQDALELRLFRRKDETEIAQEVAKLVRDHAQVGDPTYFLRLGRHIVSVNGEAFGSPLRASEYVQKLEGPDSLALRNAIDLNGYGYELDLEIRCPLCGSDNDQTLPISAEFFRPRPRRRSG
jgi:hypothetical protein